MRTLHLLYCGTIDAEWREVSAGSSEINSQPASPLYNVSSLLLMICTTADDVHTTAECAVVGQQCELQWALLEGTSA